MVRSKGSNLTIGSGSKNKFKYSDSTSRKDTLGAFMGSGQFSLTTIVNANITKRILRFCHSHISHTH